MNSDAHKHNYLAGAAEGRARSEPELRAMIVQALRASGIAVEEQVVSAAGIADIVTVRRDVVIEVKIELTRKRLYAGIAQVLLYKQAINPRARAIVVGYRTEETAALMPHAAALGVEVVCWEDGTTGIRLRKELLSRPATLNLQPFTLQWNVQTLALAQGITTVAQLGQTISAPRQSLGKIWNGSALSVSLAMLERLAQRLRAAPDLRVGAGDWFRWEPVLGPSMGSITARARLTWNIKTVAEQVGLDAAQLAFRARQYPQQIAIFWGGEAQFVNIQSLARLAAALETDVRPFDVGELFRRAES
jgi:transcriptional regulator with XRE-family HTH domain